MKIVLATGNKSKVREIKEILTDSRLKILTLDDFTDLKMPVEDADTFIGNALIKARGISEATGCAALADDSGLEVDALGGAPGVYSARYAGADATDRGNVERLLKEMEGVEEGERGARFKCAIALVDPEKNLELTSEGILEGSITLKRKGANGFGYDPVFLVPGINRTTAELVSMEKNRLSHRKKALVALSEKLEEYLDKKN